MERTENVKIVKYILRFGLFYLLALVVIAIITTLLKINSNSSSMASVILATMMTSLKFINDNKRVPNASEKAKLVWYSFTATWIVSFVLVLLFLSISGELGTIIELLSKVSFGLVFGIVLFVSALEILLLYFGYGWLANKQYEGLVKKGKIS